MKLSGSKTLNMRKITLIRCHSGSYVRTW